MPQPFPAPRATPLMRRRACLRTLLAAPAALALSACGSGDDPAQTALRAEADAAVAAGLVALALGHVGRTDRQVAVAGRRRLGQEALASADDRFPLGSCTKAMTCAAVLALAEQGGPDPSTTLAQAFAPWAAEIHPALARVTLTDLLHHRAGLPAMGGDAGGGDDQDALLAAVASATTPLPTTLAGRRAWATRWLLARPPVDGLTPGRDFAYSNAGYVVAAAAIEALTGETFEALFQRLLLDPLGLDGDWCRFLPTGDEVLGGHAGTPGALERVLADAEDRAAQPWLDLLRPAGLWACTPDAHARWLQWHVWALQGRATPLPRAYTAALPTAASGAYVWGWMALATGQRQLLVHTGGIPGYMTETLLDATGDFAAFGLSNTFHTDAAGHSWVMQQLEQAMVQSLGRLGVGL